MADGNSDGKLARRARFLSSSLRSCLNGRRFRMALPAIVSGGALLVVISGILWLLAPSFIADPMLVLEKQRPAKTYVDRYGKVIWQQPGWDYQWRYPVALSEISAPVIQCILAAEDIDFYQHHGVNYRAIARAAWQNLSSGNVVSGASTISMQLAGLSMPKKKRTLSWKWRQAAAARKLEKHYSKDRILNEYLNRILFGGKIHGIEAAAQFYFGLSARDLNWAEASLLCGLPQRPNAYRPDRHLARAKDRQRVVLHLLTRHGVISAQRAAEILHQEPLRFRDFTLPAPFEKGFPQRYRHYFELAQQEQPNALVYACPLDTEYESLIHHALTTQRNQLPNVDDAAAVLLDSRSGAVLALVGTLDFAAGRDGQVNAATATRSAGSTLKPFIYAEAIDGGIIVDSTVLLDAPLRYGDYSPGNYDGVYRGRVSATEALSLSLNTPAVRLLAKLGVPRMSERLHSLGLLDDMPQRSDHAHGLSLVLGSAGHSLLDLTNAYATLARGGRFRPCSFLRQHPTGGPQDGRTVFTPGACAMVNRMLRQRPLSGAAVDTAWKTGTANGNHDAWCIAYTPDFTLGVWFGNKDGRPAAALSGANAAAPCAAAIIAALYRNHQPPEWPDIFASLCAATLCAESGLAAGATCIDTRSGLQVAGVPLQRCTQCKQTEAPTTVLHILSPAPGTYLCGPDGHATIPLHSAESSCLWFIDDQFIGALPAGTSRPFLPGPHSVLIIDEKDGCDSARVTFTVKAQQ